ncbi:MAG: hypothetical protein ACI4A5_11875 [Hominilimicola sp.]
MIKMIGYLTFAVAIVSSVCISIHMHRINNNKRAIDMLLHKCSTKLSNMKYNWYHCLPMSETIAADALSFYIAVQDMTMYIDDRECLAYMSEYLKEWREFVEDELKDLNQKSCNDLRNLVSKYRRFAEESSYLYEEVALPAGTLLRKELDRKKRSCEFSLEFMLLLLKVSVALS